MVARYLAELRTEISDVVYLQQYHSYDDVCRLALKVESQLRRKGANQSRYPNRSSNTDTSKRTAVLNPKPATVPTPPPNAKNPVEKGQVVRGGTVAARRCYKCQGVGHFTADCPNQNIVTFVEEEIEPVFDDYDEPRDDLPSEEEEITYADSGELLVVRRALDAEASEYES